jgi:histone acetyltransferase (RNA polymerase elongator complex component)
LKTHYTIPIFIPESACPFRCSYCNQYNITDKTASPSTDEVVSIIHQYLSTIPFDHPDTEVKLAFFGGSFTGLSIEKQKCYLEVVQPFINSGHIKSIQLSTRPDYINDEILRMLKLYHVSIIELGTQSLDPMVLSLSKRGHTVADVEQSALLIRQHGFELGLQMMIGLPGDTLEKSIDTARKIVDLKADFTRIYPTLVIKNTDLEQEYLCGKYTPLTIEQAVNWCAQIVPLFEINHIKILRIGLHPSEGLINRDILVAGPFHVSFKELVFTKLWRQKLEIVSENVTENTFEVEVPHSEINYAIGYQSSNKKWLEQKFKKVVFKQI